MPKSRQKRKVRWRLRTLLLGITVLSGLLACWRFYVEPYRIQNRAATRLAEKGGFIETQPSGPRWVRAVVGEETMRDVVRIELQLGKFDNKDMQLLADLPHTNHLIIKSSDVTDEGIRYLQGLEELTDLVLDDVVISDVGLAHLSSLHNLRKLMIYGDTNITPSGIEWLKAERPNLEVIR